MKVSLTSVPVKDPIAAWKERGIVFKGEPQKTEWGTQVTFDDTCGNFIQIHQP